MPPARREYRPERPIVAELAAGAVVLQRASGKVGLLFHRAESRWALPKGHVDPGESLATAAGREVTEETGLQRVTLGEEVAEVHYRFFDARRDLNVYKVCVYFLGETDEPEFHPEPTFERAEWVDFEEAVRRVPYETDRTVLRAAQRHLDGNQAAGPGGRARRS
jgi:8-oxo-dGTP pyrophosphatase MutT (NUDIX family)